MSSMTLKIHPEELIFDKFETNIFDGNSLRFPIIGTEENISNLIQRRSCWLHRKSLFDKQFSYYCFWQC